ncbi:MAG: hypothetical protein NZ578_12355 [Candidatus Binatia bacterium]|nr:hypothetical protein [Candidatus Binatia bacterium]
MTSYTVHYDARCPDDTRRGLIFQGQLFVYSPRPSTLAFIEFARELIREAFAPLDPQTAQYHLAVEQYAEILGKLKPSFIHHPESKRHLQQILTELGCDPDKTYFDVPKLRSSTSDNYLTTGIAYAWHPHRDTWYSAPLCQINWWIPIWEIRADNAMAFHPQYWHRPVQNNSAVYNYYEWNLKYRGPHVATLTKHDPRPLPRATEPLDLDQQVRLIVPPGGIILFSAAQMHSSVPNTSGKTRWSIDFRTVHVDDVAAKRGAPHTDEACTGTTMRDYLRVTDLTHVPDDLVALYDDGTVERGRALYEPTQAR